MSKSKKSVRTRIVLLPSVHDDLYLMSSNPPTYSETVIQLNRDFSHGTIYKTKRGRILEVDEGLQHAFLLHDAAGDNEDYKTSGVSRYISSSVGKKVEIEWVNIHDTDNAPTE